MSKKSKKRKRRRLSSSSSEDDDKASQTKHDAKTSKSAHGKPEVKHQKSSAKLRQSDSSAIKDDSQSTRKIKKPVYKLAKATDHKPLNTDEHCTKTKSDFAQPPRGDSSRNTKHISGKNNTVSQCRTAEKKPSDPLSITSKIPHRTERISTVSKDEVSSQRSPSKLKKQLMSPRLVSAEQKDWRHNVPQKRHGAEKSTRREYDRPSVKTKEPANTSSCSLQQKWESVKKMCEIHKERECKPKKGACALIPSASATRHSSTLPIHSTSESSPKVLKNVTLVVGRVTSLSSKTAQLSPQQQMHSFTPPLRQNFKIPKKVLPRPVDSTDGNKHILSKNTNLTNETQHLDHEVSVRTSAQERFEQPHKYLSVAPSFPLEGQDKSSSSSLPGQLPTMSSTDTEPWDDQMQVVEELHLARSQKILGVNIKQSYGELTCMDIDSPEESHEDPHDKQCPQKGLILVLDTNILLSHLKYVKNIRCHGLGGLGFPVILIPWVVLQELDSLKKGKGLSDSVSHLATPAISYIYDSLKSREPYLWGQSMQQATESSYGLNAENNDDRVLQCCLQYQSLYPGCALILCTNDKNLCSKALLSGVKAVSQNDLEAEVGTSKDGYHLLQKLQNSMLPLTNHLVSSSAPSSSCKPGQQHNESRTKQSVGFTVKVLDGRELSEDKWDLSRCVSELEDCLQEVLSDVLEVEMKAVYEDLWLEIVYIKPPWTLQGVLQCLKKHWIAVFGHIVPRTKHQTILYLIDFFNSDKTVDCSATLAVLHEANDLVKAFRKSSSRVPSAISVMDNIFNKLQAQGGSPAGDVIMVDDEDKQPVSAPISHQEVWALFENIWSNVVQVSLEVFKALGFDPHTMQRTHLVQAPPPPQEALACLHKLSSMVSQLLQAFSSVLSSAPGVEEVQTLFSIIHSNEIVKVDSRLSPRDLLDCFSQQEYREKLRVGGNQLMEVKQTLDRCVEATGEHITFTT